MGYLSATRSTASCTISGVNSDVATMDINLTNACIVADSTLYEKTTGKLYFEFELVTVNGVSGTNNFIGIVDPTHSRDLRVGFSALSWSFMGNSGRAYNNSALTCYPDETVGAKLMVDGVSGCVAVDLDTGDIWIGADDSSGNFEWLACTGSGVTSDPATGADPLFSAPSLVGVGMTPAFSLYAAGSACKLKLKSSEFTFPIPSGFTAWDSSSVPGVSVSMFIDQPYAIIADIVRMRLVQTYNLQFYIIVALEQIYGLRMSIALLQHYGNAPIITKILSQYYGESVILTRLFKQYYGDALLLRIHIDQPYSLPAALQAIISQKYAISGAELQAVYNQLYDLRPNDAARAGLAQPYTVADGGGKLLNYSVSVTVDGLQIEISQANIEASRDNYCLSCDLIPSSQADYMLCVVGSDLTVTINGAVFEFFIESRQRRRGHGTAEYTISCLSRTALLDAPYADPVTDDLSGMASAIVAGLAPGYTLDWRTIDWYVPADTLMPADQTPLAIIRQVAAAVGAIVQTEPDGTMVIEPAYPVALPDWPAANPAVTLSDAWDFFTTGETFDHRPGYNRFLISDQLTSDDTLRVEEEAVSTSQKIIRVYQTPWRGDDFDLRHTGGHWVSVEDLGVEDRQVDDELVEFISGAGNTAYPIYERVSMEWLRTDLGSVVFGEDGALLADVEAESLLKITYLTRCRKYLVTDQQVEPLQLVVE